MKNLDKMGVVILMAHLVITLSVIGAYLFTVYIGKPDEGLKIAIPIIIGYWFGAIGKDQLTKKKDDNNNG
jgi:hypothetical protein